MSIKDVKDGIEYERKNNKKAFEDAEFINPHFLGVGGQHAGKKVMMEIVKQGILEIQVE